MKRPIMQTTIRGGERAIHASHARLAEQRRGDPKLRDISVVQVSEQLSLGVDRVMCEGALYDRKLAALAIKQAQGDLVEAIFLVRAFRTTLRRFGASEPIATDRMLVRRRIATILKNPPGGQFLGSTYDYTHRLIDFSLETPHDPAQTATPDHASEANGGADNASDADDVLTSPLKRLRQAGLIESTAPTRADDRVADITRDRPSLPLPRDARLQALARGDEGFLLGLAYSSMRGLGRNHPFVADLRVGDATVDFMIPELGFSVAIAEIAVTECRMVNEFSAPPDEPPRLTEGYGLALGQSERKAISVAVIERALRAAELGEEPRYPVQDEEFVILHADNVTSSGLVQHLKLPHYVDFQSQLQLVCELREQYQRKRTASAPSPEPA
jgi:alpha-D-ribose 1-methylphosphonate 5-triphosphate synthase subunit PhnI